MDKIIFLKKYIDEYVNILKEFTDYSKIIEVADKIKGVNDNGNKVVFAGNGASAAMSSHAALDFKKQAKISTLSFNDAAFLTAYSNDYGYDRWVQKAIEHFCVKNDIAILISSSGKSPNIINGANKAKQKGVFVVTFSGFDNNNKLMELGDINFWLSSKAYNIIENIHQIWLMMVCDTLIGKKEYSVVEERIYE